MTTKVGPIYVRLYEPLDGSEYGCLHLDPEQYADIVGKIQEGTPAGKICMEYCYPRNYIRGIAHHAQLPLNEGRTDE